MNLTDSSELLPIPKSAKNGRLSEGVQLLQKYWFQTVPCSEMDKSVFAVLVARRRYSLEAGTIYCSSDGNTNNSCKRSSSTSKRKNKRLNKDEKIYITS